MVVVHPPCIPQPSCGGSRCHPLPPPCKSPEKCLRKCTSKGSHLCESAVSIVSNRSRLSCPLCAKGKNKKSASETNKFFKRKSKQDKQRKADERKRAKTKAPCCKHAKAKPRSNLNRKKGGCVIL